MIAIAVKEGVWIFECIPASIGKVAGRFASIF